MTLSLSWKFAASNYPIWKICESFSLETGPKVNFEKSMLVPINMTEQESGALAAKFGYAVGSVPSTYMGLPLRMSKPKIVEFFALGSKISNTSTLFSQARRLQLTDSVFSALPTFYMCTFKLHKTMIKQVDKYRKKLSLGRCWFICKKPSKSITGDGYSTQERRWPRCNQFEDPLWSSALKNFAQIFQ